MSHSSRPRPGSTQRCLGPPQSGLVSTVVDRGATDCVRVGSGALVAQRVGQTMVRVRDPTQSEATWKQRVAATVGWKPGSRPNHSGLRHWNAYCAHVCSQRGTSSLPTFRDGFTGVTLPIGVSAFAVASAGSDPFAHPFIDFIRYLHDIVGVKSGATVSNYVSAIRSKLTLFGQEPSPSLLASDLIKRLSQQPSERHHKDPATPDLIRAVVADTSVDLGIRLSVSIMWHLACRVGDVVPRQRRVFDDRFTVLRKHVNFLEDGRVAVSTPRSKSDRLNLGSVHYLTPTGGDFCPVALLLQYMAVTERLGYGSDEPLLRRLDGSAVTRADVVDALKSHAVGVGLDPVHISAHSTRIGAATRMVSVGLSLADILLAGRWASEQSCLRYLRLTTLRLDRIAASLSLEPGLGDSQAGGRAEAVASE